MAQLIYAPKALEDLERMFVFLEVNNIEVARDAAIAIRSAVEMLSAHPLVGRIVEETRELRELVISYGRSGYLALYRYRPLYQEVRILSLRHQRERDYR